MTTLDRRYEILFVYECQDCNPNGDPLDENRPRTDPETGQATITDVRIKRTVRDWFLRREPDVAQRLQEGLEILIRDTAKPDGFLAESKDRAEQFLDWATKDKKRSEKRQALESAVLDGCIDARLFGVTLPLGKEETALQLTGPVQFAAFNRSLHRVVPTLVQQTAAYAGNAKVHQKSFAERWLVPYALIAAHAVVNEMAARTTRMTDADLEWLLQALWKGTANLNTHSKMGHNPLLLLIASYQPGYRLGALANRLSLTDRTGSDAALRSTADFALDVSSLLAAFQDYKALIDLRVCQDSRLRCKAGAYSGSFLELAEQISLPITAFEY